CHAPWGGLIVLPVVEGRIAYVIGIAAGAITTAVIVGIWKPVVNETEEAKAKTSSPAPMASKIDVQEGEYDVVAVTCCPSGVAHTFMAAKALEKAAEAAGIKIKVETQGQNGLKNRLSELDIANAKLVILAHDIPVKGAKRFDNVNVIECSTKEAMKDASSLLSKI
ncbi:MAG: fructose PTS transporter subunit IIB, partial [Vibrionaceae bacterium]